MPRPTNNNEESMTRSVNGTVFDYNINASMVPGTTVGAIEFMVRASANGWRPITVDPGPLKAPAYWRSDRQLWEPSVPGEIPTGQWRMMAGWKQEPAVTPMKAAALAAWPPFSLGLVMGLQPLELGPRTFVVALDIDVDDPAAAAEVDAALVGVLGNSPVRFGRRPRRTRLYRVVEETPNWTSARFRLPTDPPEHKGQHVQLLGAGKQTIAFGIHGWLELNLPGDEKGVRGTVRSTAQRLRSYSGAEAGGLRLVKVPRAHGKDVTRHMVQEAAPVV